MKNQIRAEWPIIIILGLFSIGMTIAYKNVLEDYRELSSELSHEIKNHRYCSVGLETALVDEDQCQIDLKEQRAEWLWVREQSVICNAENDGLKFAIDKYIADSSLWMDSSNACYTAQDEVLIFLDQALKNMDSFYCSEILRTDEIACNIMDARFTIVENLELMYEGCYPE